MKRFPKHPLVLVIAAATSVQIHAQVLTGNLTNGLIGLYKFDSSLSDSSSQGNNLTDTTSAFSQGWASYGTDRLGALNSALSITYAYTQLTSQSSLGLSGNQNVSLGLWIKPEQPVEGIWLAGFGSLSTPMGAFAFSLKDVAATGVRLFNYSPSGTGGFNSAQTVSSGSVGPLAGWNHIMAVYSGDASNVSLYLNGQLLPSSFGSSPPSADTLNLSDSPLYVGVQPGQDISGNMKGMVDELVVYNRALSSNEVTQVYLVQSVPEPSTYVLVLLGGAIFAFTLMRRKTRFPH